MTWPAPPATTALPSNQLDAGTDVPANARDQLLQVRARTQEVSEKLAEVISNGEPMLAGRVVVNHTPVAALNLDLGAGNSFSKTITANSTFTVSNTPASGKCFAFVLDLINAGAYTVTWWAGVKWPGGSAPTWTASGRDVAGFMTYDGGTTWTGVRIARDVK